MSRAGSSGFSEADFGKRTEFYTFDPDALAAALAEFEIVREVGKGSMGIVYEARRKTDREQVAIKVLPPSLTLTERALARFLREAELMRKVEHPSIVRVLDLGRRGRLSYFVMEFVEGVNLDERVEIGPLPIRDVIRIGIEVARALQYAHERGIVHRDVKPGNLIQRADGSIAITDFGLARETGTGSMTESGAIVGTPMYMAPEQVLGDRAAIGSRSDVYGLGATLYTLLAGRPPFQGPTAQAVLKQVLERRPPRLQTLRAEVPRDLAAIVDKAMDRDPTRRYGSAADLAEDLERHAEQRPVTARLPGPVRRAVRAAAERPLPTTLVAVIIALSATGFVLVQERHEREMQALLAAAERTLTEGASGRDERGRTLPAEERRGLLFAAVARASDVIATDPGASRAWFVRAKAWHLLREYRKAIADLDRAEQALGGATPEILHYRIDALAQTSDGASRERLRDDLRLLLELDPGRQSRNVVARHLLNMAEQLPDPEHRATLDYVERMMAQHAADGPDEMIVRARVAELRGDRTMAVDTMQNAAASFPGDPVVIAAAAALYRRLGLAAEGRAAEEMARLLDPGFDPEATEPATSVDVGEMHGFLDSLGALMESAAERR